MSLIHIQYNSQSLGKQSGMLLVLPDGDGPFQVVYQLHGLSDDYTNWQRYSSIERYANDLGLMVVMPDGGRSFYCDAKIGLANYEQHILEVIHFVDRTFHTINAPEGRGIGGLSMGGYGAMKLGLKYPDIFGSIASHSGVLDIATVFQEEQWAELKAIYGDSMDPAEDCFALAAESGKKPVIYFDCGVDDFLIEHNRRFHAHLASLGIEHSYQEYPGAHTWEFWDTHITSALKFHQAQFTCCVEKG